MQALPRCSAVKRHVLDPADHMQYSVKLKLDMEKNKKNKKNKKRPPKIENVTFLVQPEDASATHEVSSMFTRETCL